MDIKKDEAMVANESRKAARRMLERTENMRDIANALYLWNAQMMASANCILMPGDCCICGAGGLQSARGAMISLDPDEILALVDQGVLSKIFNPDDLNAPDFSDHMHSIFGAISSQRNFRDAPHYYQQPELHKAIAVYDVPGPTEDLDTQISVERTGHRFGFVTGLRDDLGTMRECTYHEFNPANLDIMAEINNITPEYRNKDDLFSKIEEAYLADGNNDVPVQADVKDPRDEPGFASLSPMEKLERLNAYTDYRDKMQEAERPGIDNDIPLPGKIGRAIASEY